MTTRDNEPIRLVCPKCRSRLEVFETTSGGRDVSVLGLGEMVARDANALHIFIPPESGPDITCPACGERFDPSSPYRAAPRRR